MTKKAAKKLSPNMFYKQHGNVGYFLSLDHQLFANSPQCKHKTNVLMDPTCRIIKPRVGLLIGLTSLAS